MWLPLQYTYHQKESFRAIAAGRYNNIRVAAGNSQDAGMKGGAVFPWLHLQDAAKGPLIDFSSPCYYFAESLTNLMGNNAIPIGLVATAIGGSKIEEWITEDVAKTCAMADVGTKNEILWSNNILPYIDMTIKG